MDTGRGPVTTEGETPAGRRLPQAAAGAPTAVAPVTLRAGGRLHRLHPLSAGAGPTILLHLTRTSTPLPPYADRRAIVRRMERRVPGSWVVFRHVLRGEEVSGWVAPWPGGPGQYREHSAGDADPPPVPSPDSATLWFEAPGLDTVTAAAIGQVVGTVVGRIRGRGGTTTLLAGRLKGPRPSGLRSLGRLQQWIEASDDPLLVRAVWRAVRSVAILDPCCGPGVRLLAAFHALAVIHEACLQRMRVWTDDLARRGAPGYGKRLADFRAVLDRANDRRHHAHPGRFISRRILRDNLFGADPDAHMLTECARRLCAAGEGVSRGGSEPQERHAAPSLNLRPGTMSAGFATLRELRSSLRTLRVDAGELRRAEEELETIGCVRRLLRASAEVEPPGSAGTATQELDRRVASLRAKLDRWSAWAAGIPPHDGESVRRWIERVRPLHSCVEFGGHTGDDGFDLVFEGERSRFPPRPVTRSELQRPPARRPAVRERPHRRFVPAVPASPPPPTAMAAPKSLVGREDAAYPPAVLRRLGQEAPATLHLRGDAELLGLDLLAVFCSVRVTGNVILRSLDAARELRDRCIATIGGFQSPLERECLGVLVRGAQPVVVSPARRVEPMRLPAAWRAALADRRLLLVSRFDARIRRPTSRTAELRNLLVGAAATRVLITNATPGGRLAQLARRLVAWETPVFTWDEPGNADLIRIGVRPISSVTQCFEADAREVV